MTPWAGFLSLDPPFGEASPRRHGPANLPPHTCDPTGGSTTSSSTTTSNEQAHSPEGFGQSVSQRHQQKVKVMLLLEEAELGGDWWCRLMRASQLDQRCQVLQRCAEIAVELSLVGKALISIPYLNK